MSMQLQDSEIVAIQQIQIDLNRKYSLKPRTEKTINEIESEAIEKIAALGWIAHVDAFPILQGEQLTITLLQRVNEKPFDHEQKQYDVLKAAEKNETVHGESRLSE